MLIFVQCNVKLSANTINDKIFYVFEIQLVEFFIYFKLTN